MEKEGSYISFDCVPLKSPEIRALFPEVTYADTPVPGNKLTTNTMFANTNATRLKPFKILETMVSPSYENVVFSKGFCNINGTICNRKKVAEMLE